MALTKVSGGILDPGINVAGIVTATGFDGPFIGGSDGINAGIGTFTGLDVNGNGDISGNLVIGGNLTANGDFTTLNTTLREVEILRVDADTTAVAGIITQRGSGDIFSVYDTSTEVFKIADGGAVTATGNFTISNTEPYIRLQDTNNDDDFIIRNTNGVFTIRDSTNGVDRLTIDSNGKGTFTTALDVTGDLTVESTLPQIILKDTNNDDDFTIRNNNGVFTIRDATNGADRLTIDSGGQVLITHGGGSATPIGTTSTLRVVNTGSSASYSVFEAQSAQGYIRLGNDGKFYVNGTSTFQDDVTLQTANSKNIVLDKSDNSLTFGDNVQAKFGDSGDLAIFHNGSNSFIDESTGTGRLIIRSSGLDIKTENSAKTMATFNKDGAVELYHNNTLRLETRTNDVKFHGGLVAVDNVKLQLGSSGDLQLFHDGSNSYVSDPIGIGNLRIRVNTGQVELQPKIGEYGLICKPAGAVELYHNNSKKFQTQASGAKIFNTAGSGGTRLEIQGQEGEAAILQLNADDGDDNADYSQIYHGTDGAVLFRNFTSGSWETNIKTIGNGAVELYHDNTKRLETSATGITVTGEVAASQDYPNFRPTLDLNFAAQKKLDPRITYQRTGPASFVNEFGKVVLVGTNAPRFDHDPITRESKGLLSEPTRTNFLKYSVDFASLTNYDPNYSGARSTLTSTTELAPDGTNTASKYVRTSGQGTGEVAIIINNSLGLNNTAVYTSSVFVKNVGTNGTVEMVNTRASGVEDDSQFNLATGTIGTEGSNNSLTTITPYPNGWYRISVTAAHNNLSGYFWVRTYGQPEGSGFLLWGGQVEAGRYPTSYIPTYNNASETRGEDLVLIDGTEFTDFFNTTEGTSVVHAHMPYSSTSSGLTAYAFKNSSNSNVSLSFSRDSGSDPAYHYYHDGSNSGYSRASATTDNMYKGALSFKTSDLDSYVNGSLNTNTTTFTMPTIDNLRIGGVGSENQLGGHVARFMYYPVKLTNNQLATLTS